MSRLLLIFTTGELGGVERRLINSTRIFNPSFILFAKPSHELINTIGSINSIFVISPTFKYLSTISCLLHLFNIINLFLFFIRSPRSSRHDVISTSLFGSYYVLFVSLFFRLRHISVIGTASNRFNNIHRFLLKYTLRTCDLILTNSIETYNLFATYSQTIFTFDKPIVYPRSMHLSEQTNYPIKITLVANMRPVKNPEITAIFINKLVQKTSNISFTFVGRSMHFLTNNLSNKALNLTFDAGPLPYSKTIDLISQSNFFLSLSEYEGMPNAVLEALSNGILPILSDIAPHRELLSNGYNDYLIDLNFIDKEVDRILPLLNLVNYKYFRSCKPFCSVSPFVLSSPSTQSVLNNFFLQQMP